MPSRGNPEKHLGISRVGGTKKGKNVGWLPRKNKGSTKKKGDLDFTIECKKSLGRDENKAGGHQRTWFADGKASRVEFTGGEKGGAFTRRGGGRRVCGGAGNPEERVQTCQPKKKR